ncbi:MAG TPA: hypothetical protein VG917_04355 [Patescibacteria group bacterium]|nr:hypothetical protein [Patescibacteria group bacterium]
MLKTNLGKIILAFFIFIAASVYITYPLIVNLGSLTTGFGDELVISWIMNWVIHALITNPLSLFQANIYYPYTNTLAYSDLHLISSIMAAPIVLITREPIVAINFTMIVSLILLPFGIFLLSYYLTKNFATSLIAGFLVVFSPAVLDKRIHLQMLALEWIPFSIIFFLNFVRSKQFKFISLAVIFSVIQIYNCFMAGYFLILFYFVYFTYVYFFDGAKFILFKDKKILLLLLGAIVAILPFVIPYYQVSKEFSYTRDIRDTIHFALQPEDLLYPNETTRLQKPLLYLSNRNKYPENAEIKTGYLGFVFTVLSICALIYVAKNRKNKNNGIINIFLIASILGLLLSFGPFLHFGRVTIHHPLPIPLPYLPFYYLAPGFKGFRNSSRFEMMSIIFIAPVIAYMLADFSKKKVKNIGNTFFGLLILLIVLEYNFPMQFYPALQAKNFPKIYSYLNSLPTNSKIIIMPIFNWNMWGNGMEIEREFYSTVEYRAMVNGSSGFSPPPWQNSVSYLHINFPNKKSIEKLALLKLDYIIVDKKTYDLGFSKREEKEDGMEIVNELNENNKLSLVKKIDNFYVFKLKHK